ncbi:MAG: glycosyl hydrolase [Planctomycetota bacterium]
MGPESTNAIAHATREAGRLDLEMCVEPASSWMAGGSWVKPENAAKQLYISETSVQGPQRFSETLPFPRCPNPFPGTDGLPKYYEDVAVLAFPLVAQEKQHQEFVFELAQSKAYSLDHAVIHNFGGTDDTYYSKEFSIQISTTTDQDKAFKEVVRAELKAATGAQTFRFDAITARYIKLIVHSGYRPDQTVELSEFEVYSTEGTNVIAARNGGKLLKFTSQHAKTGAWSAACINDGKTGSRNAWCSRDETGRGPIEVDMILDLSSRFNKSGQLTWDVPEGNWYIIRVVCTNTGKRFATPSPNSDGYVVDYLSPASMRGHLESIFDQILKELGCNNFAGTGMVMSELGSPEINVDRAWTQDFRTKFRNYRGYDVVRYLPAVFGWTLKDEEYTERFMHDWKKTISDLMCDTYKEANQCSHEYGLLMRAESGGPGGAAEGLKALGAVDIPQGEFWVRPWKMYLVKMIACASHIYGRKIVDAEAFTGPRHWELGPFDYKTYADRAFYEGLNRFCYHNMTHTHPDGGVPGWMFGWGEHFSVTDTWWAKSKPFHHDYIARSCYVLQQGLFVGDVCYYYGDHGGAQVGSKKSGNPSNVSKLSSHHMEAHRTLPGLPNTPDPSLGFGYDYDVCNQEVLQTRMSVKDGRIVLPDGMSYELLALRPDRDIDYDVLKKLEELVIAGATIVGPKPIRSNSLTDYPRCDERVKELAGRMWGPCDGKTVTENRYGKGRVAWTRTLRELLQQRGIGPDFSFVGGDDKTDIEFIHRRTANEDIYYVVNTQLRWEDIECTFRVKGRQPELWITDDASVRKVMVYDTVEGGTRIPLHLPPAGSAFVVFRDKAPRDHIASIKQNGKDVFPGRLRSDQDLPLVEVQSTELLAWEAGKYEIRSARGKRKTVHVKTVPAPVNITGPWKLNFPKGWGAPESKVLDKLISWTKDSHKDIKHFSGTATYQKTFDVPKELMGADKHVTLDLGGVKNVADVWVNENHLGILWKKPFRVDVTEVLKPGKNTLKIEITNLWRNRLIGDENLPREQRRTNTNIRIPKNAPLLESGLLGPVRLLVGKKMDLLPPQEWK